MLKNPFFWLLAVFFFLIFNLLKVSAAELPPAPVVYPVEKSIFLDSATIEKGYTIENSDKHFRLGFMPGVLLEPTRIVFKDLDKNTFTFPEGKRAVSTVYEFDILNIKSYDNKLPLHLEIMLDSPAGNLKGLYFFNGVKNQWESLPTRAITETAVKSLIHLGFARLVILEDENVKQIGHASWYKYKDCNCAASPDFPKGTLLKVTNLDNQKSLIVKVNDYGPDRSIFPERVIDLDKVAFEFLGNLRDGILKNIMVELAEK